MTIEIKDAGGGRGLLRGQFVDQYGEPCSIQTSSMMGEPCIWLGQQYAQCAKCDHKTPARMHLTQEMVRALIPLLRYFVRTGTLPTEDPYAEDQGTCAHGVALSASCMTCISRGDDPRTSEPGGTVKP